MSRSSLARTRRCNPWRWPTHSPVIAMGLNDTLSKLAATTVIGQQSGFIPGRQLADNVYEADVAMPSFSAVRLHSAAAVSFDFENVFTSLSRRWMLASLDQLEIPSSSQRCSSCESLLLFAPGRCSGRSASLAGSSMGAL